MVHCAPQQVAQPPNHATATRYLSCGAVPSLGSGAATSSPRGQAAGPVCLCHVFRGAPDRAAHPWSTIGHGSHFLGAWASDVRARRRAASVRSAIPQRSTELSLPSREEERPGAAPLLAPFPSSPPHGATIRVGAAQAALLVHPSTILLQERGLDPASPDPAVAQPADTLRQCCGAGPHTPSGPAPGTPPPSGVRDTGPGTCGLNGSGGAILPQAGSRRRQQLAELGGPAVDHGQEVHRATIPAARGGGSVNGRTPWQPEQSGRPAVGAAEDNSRAAGSRGGPQGMHLELGPDAVVSVPSALPAPLSLPSDPWQQSHHNHRHDYYFQQQQQQQQPGGSRALPAAAQVSSTGWLAPAAVESRGRGGQSWGGWGGRQGVSGAAGAAGMLGSSRGGRIAGGGGGGSSGAAAGGRSLRPGAWSVMPPRPASRQQQQQPGQGLAPGMATALQPPPHRSTLARSGSSGGSSSHGSGNDSGGGGGGGTRSSSSRGSSGAPHGSERQQPQRQEQELGRPRDRGDAHRAGRTAGRRGDDGGQAAGGRGAWGSQRVPLDPGRDTLRTQAAVMVATPEPPFPRPPAPAVGPRDDPTTFEPENEPHALSSLPGPVAAAAAAPHPATPPSPLAPPESFLIERPATSAVGHGDDRNAEWDSGEPSTSYPVRHTALYGTWDLPTLDGLPGRYGGLHAQGRGRGRRRHLVHLFPVSRPSRSRRQAQKRAAAAASAAAAVAAAEAKAAAALWQSETELACHKPGWEPGWRGWADSEDGEGDAEGLEPGPGPDWVGPGPAQLESGGPGTGPGPPGTRSGAPAASVAAATSTASFSIGTALQYHFAFTVSRTSEEPIQVFPGVGEASPPQSPRAPWLSPPPPLLSPPPYEATVLLPAADEARPLAGSATEPGRHQGPGRPTPTASASALQVVPYTVPQASVRQPSYALLLQPSYVLYAVSSPRHAYVVYRHAGQSQWTWRPMVRVTDSGTPPLLAVSIPAAELLPPGAVQAAATSPPGVPQVVEGPGSTARGAGGPSVWAEGGGQRPGQRRHAPLQFYLAAGPPPSSGTPGGSPGGIGTAAAAAGARTRPRRAGRGRRKAEAAAVAEVLADVAAADNGSSPAVAAASAPPPALPDPRPDAVPLELTRPGHYLVSAPAQGPDSAAKGRCTSSFRRSDSLHDCGSHPAGSSKHATGAATGSGAVASEQHQRQRQSPPWSSSPLGESGGLGAGEAQQEAAPWGPGPGLEEVGLPAPRPPSAQPVLGQRVALVVDASSLAGSGHWRGSTDTRGSPFSYSPSLSWEQAAPQLRRLWEATRRVRGGLLVLATSRQLPSLQQLWAEKGASLSTPDVLILGLGTEVAYRVGGTAASASAAAPDLRPWALFRSSDADPADSDSRDDSDGGGRESLDGGSWAGSGLAEEEEEGEQLGSASSAMGRRDRDRPAGPMAAAAVPAQDTEGVMSYGAWRSDTEWTAMLDRSYDAKGVQRAVRKVVQRCRGLTIASDADAGSSNGGGGGGRPAVSYAPLRQQGRHQVCLQVHRRFVPLVRQMVVERLAARAAGTVPATVAAAVTADDAEPRHSCSGAWMPTTGPDGLVDADAVTATAAAEYGISFVVQPRGPRGEWCSLYVIPSAAGKAAALRHVVRRLGLDPRVVVAAGDTDRDAELLAEAAAGVVTGPRPSAALRGLLKGPRCAAGTATAAAGAAAGPGQGGGGGGGSGSAERGDGGDAAAAPAAAAVVVRAARSGPAGVLEGLQLLGLVA